MAGTGLWSDGYGFWVRVRLRIVYACKPASTQVPTQKGGPASGRPMPYIDPTLDPRLFSGASR
jgi:hypothetical protein